MASERSHCDLSENGMVYRALSYGYRDISDWNLEKSADSALTTLGVNIPSTIARKKVLGSKILKLINGGGGPRDLMDTVVIIRTSVKKNNMETQIYFNYCLLC